MRNQRGVSLIALIITIVVMLIIAGVVVYNGAGNADNARFSEVSTEMRGVYEAVQSRRNMNDLDKIQYPLIGIKLSDASEKQAAGFVDKKYDEITGTADYGIKLANGNFYGEGYYLVTPKALETVGLKNVKRNYITNYATGEVISLTGIVLEGETFYSLSDIEMAVNGEQSTSGEYDEEKKVNKPILEDGFIPVIHDGTDWVVTDPEDKNWYDYDAEGNNAKWANMMLLDELTVQGMTNAEVRKASLAELKGKKVVTAGSMYVWIPRYSYKVNADDSISIRYSKLLKDDLTDGYIKHPAFYIGGYSGENSETSVNTGYTTGGTEVTGIWISKYEAGLAK